MLALMPVRRASSFVPSSASASASASSTASARSTAATRRTAGCPVLGTVLSSRVILKRDCLGGNTYGRGSSQLVTLRRRRRRHPRPLDRVPPREGAARARPRLRRRRRSCSTSRRPGAGASGIACGVVRNNYFQPAMSELMQACVEVWESDPAAYHYNPVGYIALGAAGPGARSRPRVYERQQRIGYRSELILGADAVDEHMRSLFPDWRAQGVTVCLHEHQGGFAFNHGVRRRAASRKCESEGVTILSGRRGAGARAPAPTTRSRRCETNRGRIEVGEQLVIAPGPWAKRFWAMLGLADGDRHPHAVRRGRAEPADVDVLEPAGRRDRGRSRDVRDRRRRRAARHPPRHRRAALHRRRRPRHRRAVGHLLQARPARRPGRRLAARRRSRRRARPVPADDERRSELRRHVVRGALARDGALRGLPAALPATRARAASARSPPTTSRSSTT